jgi:hypothetical protein
MLPLPMPMGGRDAEMLLGIKHRAEYAAER